VHPAAAIKRSTTAQIMAWAYRRPAQTRRQRQCRAQAVRHAASRIAIKVGRVWPGGNVWRMAWKRQLMLSCCYPAQWQQC
jgi:hypothetical protein